MRSAYVGLERRLEVRDVLDRRGVARGQAGALLEDLVERLELAEPERRLHVGHALVPAALGIGLDDDVLRAVAGEVGDVHRVLAQPAQALGDLRVLDGDHAALAGGDDLARMQREAGQRPERADRPPAVGRADRARGVLDDRQPVALAEREEGVHVGRQAELVDRHDRLRAARDRALGRRPDRGCRSAGRRRRTPAPRRSARPSSRSR